jgi:hypothetical protein
VLSSASKSLRQNTHVLRSPTNVWRHHDIKIWLHSIQGFDRHRSTATHHIDVSITLRKKKRYNDTVQPMNLDLNYSFAISELVRSAFSAFESKVFAKVCSVVVYPR